jgi:hypothetical protein
LGGLETGEANFATGNFVAVVTERSSDMSSEGAAPDRFAEHGNTGSQRRASEVCQGNVVPQNRGRRECRVNECTRSLVRDEKEHTSIVTTGSSRITGIPCAMVLTVSFVLSPVSMTS